jgi:hypothetical protein
LLKSLLLLMAFHSIRSERLLCEHLDSNFLFRWFLGMSMGEPSFDHSSFLGTGTACWNTTWPAVLHRRREPGARCGPDEQRARHSGRLADRGVALIKSFRARDEKPEDREPPDDPGNPTVNFNGEKRSNATHASTTDPEARWARKGKARRPRCPSRRMR